MSNLKLFVGSYAESNESGLEVFTFDEKLGTLTKISQHVGLKNPTFLNVDTQKRQLYSISERTNEEGKKSGEVARFTIEEDYQINLAQQRPSVAGTTCHIQRDRNSNYLTVVSYHGGMVGLLKLQENGEFGELVDIAQHTGHSVDPERQDRPHPHSSFYSPDGRYLFVQDLGLDIIVGYQIDPIQDKLVKISETKLTPGSGPRHLTFHPSGKFAYVINELNSTVTAFAYDSTNGKLSEIETVSTLPADYTGENGCAEITISADGRFIYGSNRGHDSIVVYEVDQSTGQLTTVQFISSGGGHPRHFAIESTGEWMFVANRDSNNIVAYKINKENGQLSKTEIEAFSTKPVCIVPVYM